MISKNEETLIWVHVTASARTSEVLGFKDGKLRVKLRQVPEKGRANKALIELLAKHFHVAKSLIEIVSGTQSRTKRIRLPITIPEEIKT